MGLPVPMHYPSYQALVPGCTPAVCAAEEHRMYNKQPGGAHGHSVSGPEALQGFGLSTVRVPSC